MEYTEYLKSEHWIERRQAALKWWDDRCTLCNGEGELHVHHRSYANLGQEPLSDLVVLCKSCHELFHNKITKQPEEAEIDPGLLVRRSAREYIEIELLRSLLFHLDPYNERIIPALKLLSFDMFSSDSRRKLLATIADMAEAASRGVDLCDPGVKNKLISVDVGVDMIKCLMSGERPPDNNIVLNGCIKKLRELISRERRKKVIEEGGDSLEIARKLMEMRRREKAQRGVLLDDREEGYQ